MNRIRNLVDDELEAVVWQQASRAVLEGERCVEDGDAHCLVTPLHYERNYAYPLIVWLHSSDGDERQVARIMPLVSMRNYVGVGIRGTVASDSVPGGYGWIEQPQHIGLAAERVAAAVAAARRWLNIAQERVFLAGYGCGGTMALRVALNEPRAFAGALSFGGAFPTTLRPLGQLHAARQLKILLATARDSSIYAQKQVCRHLRLFHTAGMSVDLRQYPCGDELTTVMLADMDRWIMSQFVEPQTAEQDEPSRRSSR